MAYAGGVRSRMRRNLILLALVVGAAGCGQPQDPADVLARARILAERHRVVEALEVIEAYATSRPGGEPLRPEEVPLWERWASLLLSASRSREARDVLLEVGRARPASDAIRQLLASAHLGVGEHAEALAIYRELPADLLRASSLDYARALLGRRRHEEASGPHATIRQDA